MALFTKAKIKTVKAGNVLAFAEVVVADVVRLRGIRVVQGVSGIHLAMPARRLPDSSNYVDIWHPLNAVARRELEALVLSAYHAALAEASRES